MNGEPQAAPGGTPPGHGKLRVFISYSRDDLDFADQLDYALRLQGFETSLDRHAISGGEEWKERLGNLIREADTVVFVLSPASAGSRICAWEVEEATRLGKRIIPVVPRALDGASAPPRLQDLNYIFFYQEPKSPGSGWGLGQTQLVEALNIDQQWLREHTRLLLRAVEWDTGGRAENRLLSGSDITAAKAWAARRPKGAPELTALHLDFIKASEQAESARENATRRALEERARLLRRGQWALAVIAALIVIGGGAVVWQYRDNVELQQRTQQLLSDVLLQKASVNQLIQRINIGRSNSYGIAAMKKICGEAVEVTSSLANQPANSEDYPKQENRFWELYFGPMNLIEMRQKTDKYTYTGDAGQIISSRIESAMVEYGWRLNNEGHPSCSNLTECSVNVKKECEAYLG
jgi:hypothetical protein